MKSHIFDGKFCGNWLEPPRYSNHNIKIVITKGICFVYNKDSVTPV